MRRILILLMALSLLASAQAMSDTDRVQKVGGDFGRAWLEKNLGPKSSPLPAGNQSNLSEADPFSEDWLGIPFPFSPGNETNDKPQNGSKQDSPYSVNRIITPVHEIDASWNQSSAFAGLPGPDKNGLINGIPAEMYYSIGPAYFDF
jgi:hypothetical protein